MNTNKKQSWLSKIVGVVSILCAGVFIGFTNSGNLPETPHDALVSSQTQSNLPETPIFKKD